MNDDPQQLPPNLTREYLEMRYRSILQEARTIERLLGKRREPTQPQRIRMERRDRTSEEGRNRHE